MAAVVPAGVALAVVAAGMAFAVALAVVVTVDVGVIAQVAGQQRVHRGVGVPAHTAVEADADPGQGDLCAAADAPADQRIHAALHQKAGQRPVAAAVGVHDLRPADLSVGDLIDLKGLGVAKVLKDLSVFISHCDFHGGFSFLFVRVRGVLADRQRPLPAPLAAAALPAAAEAVVPAADDHGPPIDQAGRDLFPGALIDLLHGGAGDVHLRRARPLGLFLQIDQADDLVLVQRQHDGRFRPALLRPKGPDPRQPADPSASLWSRHTPSPLFISGICRL